MAIAVWVLVASLRLLHVLAATTTEADHHPIDT